MPPDPLNGLGLALELSLGLTLELNLGLKSQGISYCLESGNPVIALDLDLF